MSPPDSSGAAKSQAGWFARGLMMALAVYWLALFTGTHLPIDPDIVVPGKDKMLHFVGYGGLGLLFGLTLALRSSPRPRLRREGQREGASAPNDSHARRRLPLVGAMFVLAIYGIFDELTQPLVGRTCDFHDWLADCGGIVIGLFVAHAACRWFPQIAFPGDSTPQAGESRPPPG